MLDAGAANDWRSILGQWHGVAVTVPVGLLLAVGVAEFIAFIQRDSGSRLLRTALWVCAALAAAAAVVTGWLVGRDVSAGGPAVPAGVRHQVLGFALAGVLLAVAVADVALPRRLRRVAAGIRVTGLGAAAALLAIVGLLGVTMTEGPAALRAATPPVLRPLLAPVERLAAAPTPASGAPSTTAAVARPLAVPVPILVPPADAVARAAEAPAPLVIDLSRLDADTLARILLRATDVSDLEIRGRATDPIRVAALPSFPAARSVRLDHPTVDDATVAAILARTPAAREVLLHGASVTEAVVPALRRLTALELVTVWDTALDTAAVRARLLPERPRLRCIGATHPDAVDRPDVAEVPDVPRDLSPR